MKPVRIGFLLPRYSRRSTSCWPLVVKAVADLGAEVGIVHPLSGPLKLSALQVRHDLYVLRKLSGLALSLAGALHELGATILNPYPATAARSEEHTSELQSRLHLVCRLLLEKKKIRTKPSMI